MTPTIYRAWHKRRRLEGVARLDTRGVGPRCTIYIYMNELDLLTWVVVVRMSRKHAHMVRRDQHQRWYLWRSWSVSSTKPNYPVFRHIWQFSRAHDSLSQMSISRDDLTVFVQRRIMLCNSRLEIPFTLWWRSLIKSFCIHFASLCRGSKLVPGELRWPLLFGHTPSSPQANSSNSAWESISTNWEKVGWRELFGCLCIGVQHNNIVCCWNL